MKHNLPYDPDHYTFPRRYTAPPPDTIDPPHRLRICPLWCVNVVLAALLLFYVVG